MRSATTEPEAPASTDDAAGPARPSERRMRLLVAMLEVVADKGYEATSVADVVSRAGASRKTFYAEFRNREECLLAAADLAVEAGITRVRQAYEDTPEWPARAGAGILALFELAAANPGAVRVTMVEVAAAGRV